MSRAYDVMIRLPDGTDVIVIGIGNVRHTAEQDAVWSYCRNTGHDASRLRVVKTTPIKGGAP